VKWLLLHCSSKKYYASAVVLGECKYHTTYDHYYLTSSKSEVITP
jgi:hypothetical protein